MEEIIIRILILICGLIIGWSLGYYFCYLKVKILTLKQPLFHKSEWSFTCEDLVVPEHNNTCPYCGRELPEEELNAKTSL